PVEARTARQLRTGCLRPAAAAAPPLGDLWRAVLRVSPNPRIRRSTMRRFFTTLLPLLLLAVATPLVQAQTGWTTSRPQMTRAELTDLLSRLHTISQSRDQSSEIRSQA